jgi:hypothetical protein
MTFFRHPGAGYTPRSFHVILTKVRIHCHFAHAEALREWMLTFVSMTRLRVEYRPHPMVGMTNALSPVPPPSGQRWVTVLVLVQKRTPSMPCWLMSPKAERFQPPKL